MDKITFALESFKNIQELIKFIDQKSSAVLVVAGLIFTVYIEFLEKLTFSISNFTFLGVMTFISSFSTAISLLIVIFITIFKVLKPRTAKHYAQGELSLFYYQHIFRAGKKSVMEKYTTLDENIMLKNIIDQQHEVSNILNRKTTELGKSFNWLFISIISVIIFIILSKQL